MSMTEAAGFLLALAMVLCSIRELHWSWPLAVASSVLYFFVFRDSQLYGEAALQIVFAGLALWGWRQWLRPAPPPEFSNPNANVNSSQTQDPSQAADPQGALPIRRMRSRALWQMALCGVVLWPCGAFFLSQFTDTDVPWWDGLVTALSLIGQYLLGKKYLENWFIWIVVNVLSVGLFAYKALWLTVLLYVIFTAMSVLGWRTWQKQIH